MAGENLKNKLSEKQYNAVRELFRRMGSVSSAAKVRSSRENIKKAIEARKAKFAASKALRCVTAE